MSFDAITRRIVRNRWLTIFLTLTIALATLAGSALAVSGSAVSAVAASTLPTANGSISPHAIEIDGSATAPAESAAANTANIYPTNYPGFTNGPVKNAGATKDWVKDSDNNVAANCLDGIIATCNEPGKTAAQGGVGHWNGVRLVDGVAGNDRDIFLTGGKENDVSTWNVGPGSIGSSKYDITQAYLASNQSNLYFGMERRGNNGTTAFDFEFNKLPPTNGYFPNRSVGDILFTFEMQGAGNSGSATPFIFRWDGAKYASMSIPAGTFSSINSSPTAAAPWGTLDSKGNWVLGSLDRFEFAEASVPFGGLALPGVSGCGGSAHVQVRTRSSSVETSDLKDTTLYFQFIFGSPTAAAQLTTDCEQHFTYGAAGSTDASGGNNITYDWDITVKDPNGALTDAVTLSGGGVTKVGAGAYDSDDAGGTVTVNFSAPAAATIGYVDITAVNTVTQAGATCKTASAPQTVRVYRELGVTATLATDCEARFSYGSTVTGGKGGATHRWDISVDNAAVKLIGLGNADADGKTYHSTAASGTVTVDFSNASVDAVQITAKDTVSEGGLTTTSNAVCTDSDTKSVTVYRKLDLAVTLNVSCESSFTYGSTVTGGKGGAAHRWDISVNNSAVTLSGDGLTADPHTPGLYHSTAAGGTVTANFAGATGVDAVLVTVKDTISETGLTTTAGEQCAASDTRSVTVYRKLGASASISALCDNRFTYQGAASGGKAPYTYNWRFQKLAAGADPAVDANWSTIGTKTTANTSSATDGGTFDASGSGQGAYRALLEVRDSADTGATGVTAKPQCTANAVSNSVTVYDAVGGTIALTPDCTAVFAYSATGTGGQAPYTFAWTIEKEVNGAWQPAKTFTDRGVTTSSGTLDVDLFVTGANGDGKYRAKVTITDSQGLACQNELAAGPFEIRHALDARAKKDSADGNALSVTLGSAGTNYAPATDGVTYQWQVKVNGSWTNIAGANAASLTYTAANFKTDDSSPELIAFEIADGAGKGSYKGKVYVVEVRLRVARTLNGQPCEDDSESVTITMVEAVDP